VDVMNSLVGACCSVVAEVVSFVFAIATGLSFRLRAARCLSQRHRPLFPVSAFYDQPPMHPLARFKSQQCSYHLSQNIVH
jgi:hypothetical protein